MFIFVYMKDKNFLYIATSTTLFLFLLAIHAYYFYNSFQLKQKDIVNTVHSQLTDLEEQVPYFEDTTSKEDEILILFSKFQRKEIPYDSITEYFRNKNSKTSPRITAYIDSLFQKRGYQVALKKELINLIALPSRDTLLKKPIAMYQTNTPIHEARTVTEGKWISSSSNSEFDLIDYDNHSRKEKPNFHFQINRITTFDIANLNSVVLLELVPLIVSSILILLSVSLLYYLTYKNLVKHRQESIILHDIVDNIAHEFKTPLATLKIASKTLSKGGSLEILPLIDRQINRLENILKPIQDDYEPSIYQERFQQQEIIDLCNDFAFSNPEVRFETRMEILKTPTLQLIEIQTILSNLISNSIKYGGTIIRIHINSQVRSLEITITDNGIGMEPAEIKHILKKFYRIQKNNIQNTKGLGLGLFLVNKIVLKCHGTITFKSKIHSGTVVKINIPHED